ncbi:MAG: cytochrome c3 family protein [Gemmatimonadetes bacterium]|nr:cytochrome c3 family protein [Gemmatimonadota bacterium]
MIRRISGLVLLLGTVAGIAIGAARAPRPDPFDHGKHAKLFVSCTACHVGAERAGVSIFPTAAQCATCHDGTAQRIVDWQPRVGPPITHLNFNHRVHLERRRARHADSSGTCVDCHATGGAKWMDVRGPDAPQCLSCHKLGRENHFSLPDTACATCHIALSKATGLSRERIARFPRPLSHDDPISSQGWSREAGEDDGRDTAGRLELCHVPRAALLHYCRERARDSRHPGARILQRGGGVAEEVRPARHAPTGGFRVATWQAGRTRGTGMPDLPHAGELRGLPRQPVAGRGPRPLSGRPRPWGRRDAEGEGPVDPHTDVADQARDRRRGHHADLRVLSHTAELPDVPRAEHRQSRAVPSRRAS